MVILNEYLTEMGEVIVGRFDGTVDKYIGDAIMAFLERAHSTRRTTPGKRLRRAALGRCQSAWHEIQKRPEPQGLVGLDAGDEGLVMRIGLNTGPAVVGLADGQHAAS